MKLEIDGKFYEQVLYIGNQVKTILLWQQILKKYILGSEHDEVLKNRSPGFAYAARQVLFSDMLMKLAKLGDPVETAGKSNVSFLGAKKALVCSGHRISVELRKNMKQFRAEFGKIKRWRNKSGAHLDEDMNLRGKGRETISLFEVELLIDLAVQISNGLHNLVGEEFHPQAHLAYDDLESLLEPPPP